MKLITEKLSPDFISYKIFTFAIVNEVWVFEECQGALVWMYLQDKQRRGRYRLGQKRCKIFNSGLVKGKSISIWRSR